MNLDELKRTGEAPAWLTEDGFSTLRGGYMLDGETPRAMYRRVADAAARYKRASERALWAERFFGAMWQNWLCPASPVLSNMGTTRGLPISCDSIHVGDSVDSIFTKAHELAMLSKHGAGVGIYLGDVRGRGASIGPNGASEGVIPWAKVYDSTIVSVSQGATRRGAGAIYLPIEHPDIEEFIALRRPTGDANRRCLNINHAVTITDAFMEGALAGDAHNRRLWQDLLRTRVETGEPYIMFVDAVNEASPEAYKKHNLKVKTSNICAEITLHTDPEHSFVCCLSSLNLARWDEWDKTDLAGLAVHFLEGVLHEYIERGTGVKGLENSLRSAIKGRAIGIGVLGWHSLLQRRMLAFDSLPAMMLNAQVFRTIRHHAELATRDLATEHGEPEWCRGTGRRHTHLLAVAPTVSNSIIAGGQSAGIEPFTANVFHQKTAKGTFVRKNPQLEAALDALGLNTTNTWKSIVENAGSVQHMTQLPDEMRKAFLTAREINQHALVRQAVQRQQWVDQAQSLNLFFAANASAQYVHDVHIAAWRGRLKTLYYVRGSGVLRGDLASRSASDCAACEA